MVRFGRRLHVYKIGNCVVGGVGARVRLDRRQRVDPKRYRMVGMVLDGLSVLRVRETVRFRFVRFRFVVTVRVKIGLIRTRVYVGLLELLLQLLLQLLLLFLF